MTDEEIIAALESMSGTDTEQEHITADDLLVQALKNAGKEKIAEAFQAAANRVGFWYA